MQGLFKGPGVNDVYALQRQERDQKVRQAMADSAGAGGNFYANIQAKANEQMSQALQGGVRGLLQGTDLAPAEDPRLAEARLMEKDRSEINAKLEEWATDEDGLTQKEIKLGFSELMARGRPEVAQKFLAMAQSMQISEQKDRELGIKEEANKIKRAELPSKNKTAAARHLASLKTDKKFDVGTPVYQEKDGKITMITPLTDKSTGDTTYNENVLPEGILVGNKYRTPEELAKQAGSVAVAEQDVKRWGNWQDKRQNLIDIGAVARQEYTDIGKTIALAGKIDTGGYRIAIKSVQDFLGTTSADVGDLANKLGNRVISRLKEMGSKPTDADLKFLQGLLPGLGKSKAENLRILKQIGERIDRIASRGAFLESKDEKYTQENYNEDRYTAETFNWQERGAEGVAPDPTEVQDEWNDAVGVGVSST